jgi:hypothetical protein
VKYDGKRDCYVVFVYKADAITVETGLLCEILPEFYQKYLKKQLTK